MSKASEDFERKMTTDHFLPIFVQDACQPIFIPVVIACNTALFIRVWCI